MTSLLTTLLAVGMLSQPAPSALAVPGAVVFQADFNDAADPLAGWQGGGGVVEPIDDDSGGASPCVRIERTAAQGPGSAMIRHPLPIEQLRGCRVRVEARVKAEGVAEPPHSYNGVKVMLHTVAPEPTWQQQSNVHGTFDWKPVRFVASVSRDATEAWLMLGLEATTGRAWVDDVRITVLSAPRRRPLAAPSGPVDRHTDLARLRGAMIGTRVDAEDLRVLGRDWKANHVRWQLTWGGFPQSPADNASLDEYNAWLDGELQRLDELLPVCAEVGLTVLIDLHTPPGGRAPDRVCRIFQEPRFQEEFLKIWDRIARRYVGNRTVWGYDLVNEPVEGDVPEGLRDWPALALETAQRVRAIDPDHAIIVEPAPWGGPDALEHFEPLPVPGVVYSVHMYVPHPFTHQGVHGQPVGLLYPGTIGGREWDKERLRQVLQPVVEFQRDYNVPIYIGEFSAIRWAPDNSAYRYLRDVIDLFEEYGWDWAYHAYREWDGWSVEHGPDPDDRTPSPTPTDREKLLRSWFAKNPKPVGD